MNTTPSKPVLSVLIGLLAAPLGPPRADIRCGTERGAASHLAALHRYWSEAGLLGKARAGETAGAADRDEDHVALLEDRGDLVASRNPFDLQGTAVRLTPNRAGGYDPVPLALALETPGAPLALGKDEARAVDLPFAFPFYGRRFTQVFVHADGALTFAATDLEPGERGMGRFLAGPPRVGAFFADLDPSRGGSVTASVSSDRAVFLWDRVPGGGQINRNTFQATLAATGEVDLVYGEMQTREAIVGLSPGGTRSLTAANLGAGEPRASAGALVERFSETERLDLVSATRRFYASHPDVFDQLVVYTTRALNPLGGSLAFEVNVRNDVAGIGLESFDRTAEWGSAGRLESVVFMDAVDNYHEVDGFEILAHEVGHRWLSRLAFRSSDGATSAALLGRGGVHWSFFLDTDASVMEGNDIEDRGDGRFETVDFARGYSPLDQYVMGLRAAGEVAPFFYVEGADNFRPARPYKSSSPPEAGVGFTGVRRTVRIEDVVAAMGARVPDAAQAPRLLRQAYVLVADRSAPATEARRRTVARIRSRFETYYVAATGGRGMALTHLE
ncbi:MAG TPA: hypothetical protein VMT87_14475 [Vicinamibacteria bacterium]|nr:hypothetical protein [Vicinamibacteria bacterium]